MKHQGYLKIWDKNTVSENADLKAGTALTQQLPCQKLVTRDPPTLRMLFRFPFLQPHFEHTLQKMAGLFAEFWSYQVQPEPAQDLFKYPSRTGLWHR